VSDRQTHDWYETLCDVLHREWNLPAAIRDDYMPYVPFVAFMLAQLKDMPDLDHAKWKADMLAEFSRAEEELGIDHPFDRNRAERIVAALKAIDVPG
jgi:hypothetical protein